MMPNLFLVGAMKAATTTLYSLLQQSPEVIMCSPKEPNHFCTDLFRHPEFPLALTKYRHFNEAWTIDSATYLSLFPAPSSQTVWVGDASPTYLYSTEAAGNIHAFNPEARIICLLRNPIDRAYSEYTMNMIKGLVGEEFSSRDEFLHVVHAHYVKYLNNDTSLFERYIDAGMYYEQIRRYLDYFPPEQVFVGVVDRPNESVSDVVKSLEKFLKISVPDSQNVHWNAARRPAFPKSNALLHKFGLKGFVSNRFPKILKEMGKLGYYSSDKIGEPTLGERAYLSSVYREDVAKLGRLLDQDLSFWLEKY